MTRCASGVQCVEIGGELAQCRAGALPARHKRAGRCKPGEHEAAKWNGDDVIATGTPEGVGFARTPSEFLRDGEFVEPRIEKIGVLRNQVVLQTASFAKLAPV
jgi:hypothetical protein